MQLLLGNAVGSLRIQERKIIITHTHPAKGTNCSSYPSYAFFLLEKSLNWGWRELQEVLENYTAQVTRIHVCCWDRWKGGDSLPFLTHFCWPWVQAKGCWGVVWELSQESLLMSSLCYLFLYSFLIPTIGRKLGPEKLNFKNGTLAESPREASHLWLFRVRSTDLFVYWLWCCSEQTKCHILLTSCTHLFCDQHRFQGGVGDESPPQQCRGALLCDYALQI